MEMLVKIVWLVLLSIFPERGHLKVHASINVSANGRVCRGALARDRVNGRYRILSGFVEKLVVTRDFVPSVHFGE
jgi:hypothetical protein